MTNEESKRILERYYMLFNEEYKKSLDVALGALEKQIPKKPDYIYNEFSKSSKRWRCPNCTTLMYEIDKDNCSWGNQTNYCEHCGQAIDWRDE